EWAQSVGGLDGLVARADANAAVIADWVESNAAVDFLAADPATRSNTSVCLRFADPAVASLDDAGQQAFVKGLTALLEAEKVAFDIASYRDAPPGLRIWCGATVETDDLRKLTPWLDWAFASAKASLKAAA
ncbi:MAG: phosphoserine aminotransferase, partial [Rhizobiaceae bacterium]|nr:phosphoserine aminotransferase [Rhizobiaceae bacterium]